MDSPGDNRSQAPRRKPRSRIKACIPCQKQKVRCMLKNDSGPCLRCQKRGIGCVFKRLPQYCKPNSDEALRINMSEDLQMLHTAINNILANKHQPLLGPLKTTSASQGIVEAPTSPTSGAADPTSQVTGLPAEDPSTDARRSVEPLSQVPIKSLYEITRMESLRSRQLSHVSSDSDTVTRTQEPRDLVADGKLGPDDADRLVQKFLNKTDHYLYGITSRFKDLQSIRSASSLLFTAICTVSALHESGGEVLFQVCSIELRKLVSDFVFASRVTIEDFQGLCIASFWLSDISWSVSGLAIRRAMEFQLARSFDFVVGDSSSHGDSRIQLGSQEEALYCLRVWYLFYVCDHHLSILYGRPSSFGDQMSVAKWERYFDAVPRTSGDVRLASQIDLLLLLDKVIQLFGTKADVSIPIYFQSQLEGFNRELDQWIITWTRRYEPHENIGNFPLKALTLHYHFAKLFVSSHVFRGLSSKTGQNTIPTEYYEIAQIAVRSARSIVDLVSQDLDIRAAFVATPHYYHTMIAFACSFLLKLATKHHSHLRINQQEIFGAILQVAELCQSLQCTRYHLVHWMGAGLRELITNCQKALERQSGNYQDHTQQCNMDDLGSIDPPPHQPEKMVETDMRASIVFNDAWETVREAATNMGEFLPDDAAFLNDGVGDSSHGFPAQTGPVGMEEGWEAFLPAFNFEHMGFGLL